MENTFIVRYRRALRELEEAYRLQYALIDESNDLRTLAYQQAESCEKAILKNRKSGRGLLISRLRECLDEQPYAWAITQHLKGEIEEMEANGYDSEVDNEQNRSLYYVIDDAIVVLLDVLGSQYPNKLTTMGIATYRGIIPLSEVILKFGPVPLQRIVKQRLQSATCNITPPIKSAQPLDTPAATTITAPPQAVIPVANLTPEQEKTAYYRRWDEFRNVVNISYSTPEDDATITVYDVLGAGAGDGPPGLWCPLQCAGVPLESWQDYPEGKREAIRRGFMHGLCNMIGMTPPATLADWQYFRPEICKPVIYDRNFNPLNEQAHRTGNYATGRREIEKWLTNIYAAGVQIPFHPNFENELTAHLGRVPLTGVDAFLAGFAQRKGLATPEGYTYLLNVAMPLAEAPEAGRRTVMERVVSWLRLALDTPAASAIAEPSQPGCLTPDKGGPHLGDTLDTAPAAAVWASLLYKNVAYTLADLDGLLVRLGLLTDAASRTPTADFKGSAVLGAVKALRERRYLRNNDAKLARLLTERYGDEAANPHTIKRGTNQLPETVSHVYTLALALLPAP